MAACSNLWMMMTRTKSLQLPPSKTERSVESRGNGCMSYFAALCCSLSFGVIVVVNNAGEGVIIASTIALVSAILSGICMAEFLTSNEQKDYSVYSRAYQGICELVAFIIGWAWLLSLSASFSAICKTLSACIDRLMDDQLAEFVKSIFSPYNPDILSVMLIMCIVIISITGLSYIRWWYILSLCSVCILTLLFSTVMYIFAVQKNQFLTPDIFQEQDPEKVLTGVLMCFVIFLGHQSTLRLPRRLSCYKLNVMFVPLNVACYLVLLVCIFPLLMTQRTNGNEAGLTWKTYITSGLKITVLSILALEYYHALLVVLMDMSTDGLIFRCLSKSWKPFCQRVTRLRNNLVTALLTGVLATFFPTVQLLLVAAAATVLISLLIAVTVLMKRYNYRNCWRYEPMMPSGVQTRHCSQTRSTEFLPNTSSRNNNNQKLGTDSDDNSDTDIDEVVQEYREKLMLTNAQDILISTSNSLVREPTSSTSFRAKLLICGVVANSAVFAVAMTYGIQAKVVADAVVMATLITPVLLSALFLCLLHRLPQNRKSTTTPGSESHSSVPLMPWIPGTTILVLFCLLVYVSTKIWTVLLTWFLLGLIVYMTYGIRNSTAANSFYKFQVPVQVSVHPFPKHKEVCRVIFPQRRSSTRINHTA